MLPERKSEQTSRILETEYVRAPAKHLDVPRDLRAWGSVPCEGQRTVFISEYRDTLYILEPDLTLSTIEVDRDHHIIRGVASISPQEVLVWNGKGLYIFDVTKRQVHPVTMTHGEKHELLKWNADSFFNPVFSPDGKHFLYESPINKEIFFLKRTDAYSFHCVRGFDYTDRCYQFFTNDKFAIVTAQPYTSGAKPLFSIYDANGALLEQRPVPEFGTSSRYTCMAFSSDNKYVALRASNGIFKGSVLLLDLTQPKVAGLITKIDVDLTNIRSINEKISFLSSGEFVLQLERGLMFLSVTGTQRYMPETSHITWHIAKEGAIDVYIKTNPYEMTIMKYNYVHNALFQALRGVEALRTMPDELLEIITPFVPPYEPRLFQTDAFHHCINLREDLISSSRATNADKEMAQNEIIILQYFKYQMDELQGNYAESLKKTKEMFPELNKMPKLEKELQELFNDEKRHQDVPRQADAGAAAANAPGRVTKKR